MQLQSWSPFLPTFFCANFLPHIAFFLLWPTYLLGYNDIYFNTTSFRYLLSTDIYVLSLRSIILWLSPLYLLGDIRDIREKRMKSEFSCMSYHQKNASVSFFVSISISLHIFLTFFMSFLVFIREDINFRGCWQPYHIITVLKTSRVCFTSSFSYCVHPFCYYQHTLAMKCHPKMHFFLLIVVWFPTLILSWLYKYLNIFVIIHTASS